MSVIEPGMLGPEIRANINAAIDAADSVLRFENYATPELAIAAASSEGKLLRGTPGATYTFNTGVTINNGDGLLMEVNGCNMVRGVGVADGQAALDIRVPMSAATYTAADTISAWSLASYNFGNGATFVPRLTVANHANYAVGDVVKLLSTDLIPSVAPWTEMRQADMGEIGAIDAVNSYIYLIRPFAEEGWTPTKIVSLGTAAVSIEGGLWTDEVGYAVSRKAPMVNINGLVRCRLNNMTFTDTAASGIQEASCYEPQFRGNTYIRPRYLPAQSAYGYGHKIVCGSVRPVEYNPIGSGCRHVFDTGGGGIATGDINTTAPYLFGGVIDAQVFNGVGSDSINASWADHPDAFRTIFWNCVHFWSNRRSPNSTLWSLELRGRGSAAYGGFYEGLAPFQIEASTTIPYRLGGGIVFSKPAPNDTDAALEPLGNITGVGISGGGNARVIMDGVTLLQKRGRKEMVALTKAKLEFTGKVKYDNSLSNNVVFAVGENSELYVHGIEADFSDCTAATPMLSRTDHATAKVYAPGRAYVKNSPAATSTIVLSSMESLASIARWDDAVCDGELFATTGFRNATSATVKRSITRRLDSDVQPSEIQVNFSSGAGGKTITWVVGLGDPVINVDVNPTTSGTTVGTIPNGNFVGQRVTLNNVGQFSFEINSTPSNVEVPTLRTVAVGGVSTLRWDGTNWV